MQRYWIACLVVGFVCGLADQAQAHPGHGLVGPHLHTWEWLGVFALAAIMAVLTAWVVDRIR
ncbi:MAG: hypothetical protein ACFB3T_01185 [Geminicoccaceae bacterium]